MERQKYIELLRNAAKAAKRSMEFNNLLKQFQMDYIQRMRQTGKKTAFTDQPLELNCAEWDATDIGVRTIRYDRNMQPMTLMACSHPIMPIEILKNVDTSEERITLAYFKSASWQRITVDRAVCANTNKIVDTLAQYGIEVTSDNAKNLVRYISDCVGYNPATLEPKKSINRLGWVGSAFTPYEKDIRYEGGMDYEAIFKNVSEKGGTTPHDDGCQLCFCTPGAIKGPPVCLASVGNHWNWKDRGTYGGHVDLGKPAYGRLGKDHEYDQERHYEERCIFMQYPVCRG